MQHAIDCSDGTNDHYLPDGHFTSHVAHSMAAHNTGDSNRSSPDTNDIADAIITEHTHNRVLLV